MLLLIYEESSMHSFRNYLLPWCAIGYKLTIQQEMLYLYTTLGLGHATSLP